jgi:hypothetical protein
LAAAVSLPATAPADAKDLKPNKPRLYLGIDGEGIGRDPHRYVLLAVSDETGRKRWWVENPEGLSTLECLRFLANLPTGKFKTFAYSFNYDLTKLLQDLPDEYLFRLFRPEIRKASSDGAAKRGPAPIMWMGFTLNLVGSKFTIRHNGRQIILWDIWKFYQGKFVTALSDWKVGEGEDQAEIERMKALRNAFRPEDMPEIREYCFTECKYMAVLARKLVEAHEAAGLKLTSFYGAGSTASAMLKLMGIKETLRATPPEMQHAVACAFFGGRFENAVVGEVPHWVKNYDISSAYPYQTCFLPCLLHGQWSHTIRREDIDAARTALVEYDLQPDKAHPIADWAPFPFRESDGSICFPSSSGGGWVWREEYLAGERFVAPISPGAVRFKSAWVYHCDCKCQPFKAIPHYYRERCRIGKEGAGIVFKLGPNSVYGKLAQSVGSAMFQSWIWAGLITSGCRAQLLDLIALHEKRSDVLMVATDGAFSICRDAKYKELQARYIEASKITDVKLQEKSKKGIQKEGEFGAIKTPVPLDTGTWETGKPLGGWECGDIPQGIFAARPGIYFPLNPTKDDIKKVKGRGVGKGTILENWALIVQALKTNGIAAPVVVKDIERFCGAKTSISYSKAANDCHRAAGGYGAKGQELPKYGEWIKRRVEMSFDPLPKRAGVMADGVHLSLRSVRKEYRSVPYSKALKSPENMELEAATLEMSEQPDGDFEDLRTEDGDAS